MLRSPAGFGKTTALADLATGTRAQGLLVGWISLDEDDTPNLFGSYLAAAFEHAGLDLTLLNAHDAWSSSPAVQQMGTLARAIELHAAPCLLVLDEVDRLPRRTVQLVDLLVKRAPRNLHVAMAFRSDPGLELAPHVLNDGALVLGPGDLRFSKADIARFFPGGLSRRELAAVEKRTAGWPVAVTLYRNQRTHREAEAERRRTDAERRRAARGPSGHAFRACGRLTWCGWYCRSPSSAENGAVYFPETPAPPTDDFLAEPGKPRTSALNRMSSARLLLAAQLPSVATARTLRREILTSRPLPKVGFATMRRSVNTAIPSAQTQ